MKLSPLHKRLLNEFQQDFPLSSAPFNEIAQRLGVDEEQVLDAFAELTECNAISRIGPVITPNAIGKSALVAMTIPASDLERVAAVVSAMPQVNHNYERENRFNLWFVLIAEDKNQLDELVARIELQTGYSAMVLPMLADYFIDLGFELDLHD